MMMYTLKPKSSNSSKKRTWDKKKVVGNKYLSHGTRSRDVMKTKQKTELFGYLAENSTIAATKDGTVLCNVELSAHFMSP